MHPYGTLCLLSFTLPQFDQNLTIKCVHRLQAWWNLSAHTQTETNRENLISWVRLLRWNLLWCTVSCEKKFSAWEIHRQEKYVRFLAFVRNVTCRRRRNIVSKKLSDFVPILLHKYIYRGEHRKSLTLESWEGWQVIFSTQTVTMWECYNDIVFKEKKDESWILTI